MSNRGDGSWIGFVAIILAAVFFYVLWLFAKAFGLDIKTSFSVIGRHVVFIILVVAAYYSSDFGLDIFRIGNAWPILLGILWTCWWPALDYWAIKDVPSFVDAEIISVWWDAWYTKWGVLASIVGLGYLGNQFLNN